jgi:hypothetical protein
MTQLCDRSGVECLDKLEWHDWKVGEEIKQNLSLKNVGRDVITLKYKLPADRQFILGYPDPVKLYPGVPHVVQVIFPLPLLKCGMSQNNGETEMGFRGSF